MTDYAGPIIEAGKTTWHEKISEEMEAHGDGWEKVISFVYHVDEKLWDEPETFLDHRWYYGEYGVAFTVWTDTRVYFPRYYDGGSGVASVPRSPTNEATPAVGGG